MKNRLYTFSFIGYGNLATRLSLGLKRAGHTIEYIVGRDSEKGGKLCNRLNREGGESRATTSLEKAFESEVIILALSDSVIKEYAERLSELLKEREESDRSSIVLHCSGSTPLEALEPFKERGVLYPVMTLSAVKTVDFALVPFTIEYSSDRVAQTLREICYSLNAEYSVADSSERLKLHCSAVFVSNFVNYLVGLAYDLAKPNHISLMPLAIETIRKAFLFQHPSEVQTGPAIRGDLETIEKHLELLKSLPEHREIYKVLTEQLLKQRREL